MKSGDQNQILKKKLYKIFRCKINGLRELDNSKTELFENPNYSFQKLYKLLDKVSIGYIRQNNIMDFMHTQGIKIKAFEADKILRHFTNNDRIMKNTLFKKLFPSEPNDLVYVSENLQQTIVKLFLKIVESEDDLEKTKRQLTEQQYMKCFQSISHSKKYVTVEDVKILFQKFTHKHISTMQCVSVLNNQTHVDYKKFIELIKNNEKQQEIRSRSIHTTEKSSSQQHQSSSKQSNNLSDSIKKTQESREKQKKSGQFQKLWGLQNSLILGGQNYYDILMKEDNKNSGTSLKQKKTFPHSITTKVTQFSREAEKSLELRKK